MRAGRVRMMQEQAAAKAQQGSTLEGTMDRWVVLKTFAASLTPHLASC